MMLSFSHSRRLLLRSCVSTRRTTVAAASSNLRYLSNDNPGFLERFGQGLRNTWHELLGVHGIRAPSKTSDKSKETNNFMLPEVKSNSEPYVYRGPIIYVDRSVANPWDRLQRRLAPAPLILPNIKAGHGQASKATQKFQKLQPDFSLDSWRIEMGEKTLPIILKWILEGNLDQLQHWLGPEVLEKVAAEIKARDQEGVVLESTILEVSAHHTDVWAILDNGDEPTIVLHFVVQQVHCALHKESGKVLEGGKDEVVQKSYVAAFQQMRNNHDNHCYWGIADLRYNGPMTRTQAVRGKIVDYPNYRELLLEEQEGLNK